MDLQNVRIPVMEIMSTTPVTVESDRSASDAAALMGDRSIGSLLVVSDGVPVGILTERDMVTKVVARDGVPSSVTVSDIMSEPVISVHPHLEVLKAATKMAEYGIRRLPVMEDGELVGIVTENDIIKVWPRLVEITREVAHIGAEEAGEASLGYCETCGVFSEDLVGQDGQVLCGECRQR